MNGGIRAEREIGVANRERERERRGGEGITTR